MNPPEPSISHAPTRETNKETRVWPLGEKSDAENMLLDYLETKRENSRLACQVNLTDKQDGLVVHVAPQT